MSNSVIGLNPGTGGPSLDAEKLAGAGPSGEDIYRERMQITGSTLAQVAAVVDRLARLADYALVVRSGDRSETANQTVVAASAVTVNVLAANPTTRVGASVFNNSVSANLYLLMGAGAALNKFSVKLVPGAYWEAPFGYSGLITGIWDAAVGDAQVTEYV